jgi:putative addiction module component (TIGR02574 family)
MTSVAQQLFLKALDLREDDRAELAGLLIESLDLHPEEDVEAAWSEEIRKRMDALDSGRVQPVPWEEAEALIFGDQDARRIA